ncbi:hypothetical protein J6590_013142 [Homalodisca vitripennis]|nr:hypothetical protein J6590_013142 [Homalodisca vitripennis]
MAIFGAMCRVSFILSLAPYPSPLPPGTSPGKDISQMILTLRLIFQLTVYMNRCVEAREIVIFLDPVSCVLPSPPTQPLHTQPQPLHNPTGEMYQGYRALFLLLEQNKLVR